MVTLSYMQIKALRDALREAKGCKQGEAQEALAEVLGFAGGWNSLVAKAKIMSDVQKVADSINYAIKPEHLKNLSPQLIRDYAKAHLYGLKISESQAVEVQGLVYEYCKDYFGAIDR